MNKILKDINFNEKVWVFIPNISMVCGPIEVKITNSINKNGFITVRVCEPESTRVTKEWCSMGIDTVYYSINLLPNTICYQTKKEAEEKLNEVIKKHMI